GPSRRRIESATVLLPEPDSPTSPSTLPGWIEKETPSTARTTPRPVANCVRRPSTSRTAVLMRRLSMQVVAHHARVEDVAQPAAEEVEADHGDEHRNPGADRHPGDDGHVGPALADHQAPVGAGRLRAEAEEAQRRAEQDAEGDPQAALDDD